MDILKIRELAKQRRRDAEEAAEQAQTPMAVSAEPPKVAPDLTAAPPPPAERAEAPAPPSPAVVQRDAQPVAAVARPRVGDPEPPIRRPEVDDPLRDFLARYDPANDDALSEFDTVGAVAEGKRYLAFDLGTERYATSILGIREIVRSMAVTTIPRGPESVLGVFSKRGLVMPVVDLAACLDLRPIDRRTTANQRVLVVGRGEALAGLRVDQIHGVVVLRDDELEEVPAGVGPRGATVLTGLGRFHENLHIILDVEQFLGFFKTVLCGVTH